MFYHIVTYGCQMNVHESEKVAGILEKMGYTFAEKRDDADIIVFNTCAIREGAEHRAFGNIGALKEWKQKNKNKIVCVIGCMTQQKQVAEKLHKTFPFLDVILGTHNIDKLESSIKSKLANNKRILEYTEQSGVIEGIEIKRTSGANGWVNIIYGCNNFCSYCIVPYVRGREKSRKKADILKEVKQLLEEGYTTITLLGQNVNSYGNDSPSEGNFAQLLQDICNLEGNFELTFMSSHPKDFSDDVIDVIAKNPKVKREIHLPVQSGSNFVLQRMNRKYTREQYLEIVSKLRAKMPEIKISSDFIVGFPGESEEDFEDTINLVKEVRFNMLFAYMYSKRSGTAAEKFEDQITEETKHERVNRLLDVEKEIINQRKEEK